MNKELKRVLTRELLLSKEVFLVGHNNIDLDAFGSMVGFSLIAKKFRSKVFLVIDDKEIEPATKLAMGNISTKVNIIKSKDVKNLISKKSILVVFDTNSINRICAKEIINEFNSVIVIDHHRKSKDTIENAKVFIDEKATSTCEIVSSLLYKFRIKVPKTHATILLGGIVLDTNNFTYKMTRKSFYCCYYLSTKGADVEEAQLYFKQDLEEYVNRSKIIASTKINGEIAIATGIKGHIYKTQYLAKTADILLEFKGIKNSFAIGYVDKNKVGISARSVNKLNAGRLMEAFGGGGSKNEAAAIIENTSIKKVEEELISKLK